MEITAEKTLGGIILDEIAIKVKELRKKSKMTLKDLSEATSLSTSFLSQVENGSSNLAISSLKKISEAFKVNISIFFENEKRESYSYMTKKGDRRVFQVDGLETIYSNLSGNFNQRILAPYILTLAPNQTKKDSFQFAGEEFYYVLKGAAKFTIDNKEYFIYEGDSIHFPSNLDHFGENLLDEETELLGVITPVVF